MKARLSKHFLFGALVVCAAVLLPTLAFAQAQIVGTGPRRIRRRAPRRHRRGRQPGHYRKSPHGRHRRPGPLSHRSAAARHSTSSRSR